jgi:uncharacterized protein (UPF0335 family)
MTPNPSASPAPSTDTPHRVSKTGGIAADQLRAIVERIERMQEEAAGIASDIRDIFAEAKGGGFCPKTLRKIIALRKLDTAERDEAEHMLNTYLSALGMQSSVNFESEDKEATMEDATEDELYQPAKDIVLRDRNASTSYLQRMLKLGYNRAARLVDRMEAEGIVSAANHIGKREVLK